MQINFNRVTELEAENRILKSEIQRLKILLEDASVDYSVKNNAHQITSGASTTEYIINEI